MRPCRSAFPVSAIGNRKLKFRWRRSEIRTHDSLADGGYQNGCGKRFVKRGDEKLTAFLVTVNSGRRKPSYLRGKRVSTCAISNPPKRFWRHSLGFGRLGMNPEYKRTMHIQSRYILTIATLAFALTSGLPSVSADELKEGKVTQVIQDVRVLPSNASPRPAAVNDNVHQGTAVQTGVQSRSELTFKDQTITRLGEKTIFSVGQGSRNIDLGSGQFLLYAPKKAGGAKVKMGPVTAAISG